MLFRKEFVFRKYLAGCAVTVSINEPERIVRDLVRGPTLTNPLPFLGGWSRNPIAVGWPFASSYWTARRLAQATLDAAIPGGGPILELGPGTGPVTAALLEKGCPIDQLVVVERDAQLCRFLERRFSDLQVLHGNAAELGRILARAGVSSARVVLSGLPLRIIPPKIAASCYSDAFQLMPSGGAIIQYTYGFRPPFDPEETTLKIKATFVGREWRNVPPMGIWKYRLASDGVLERADEGCRVTAGTNAPWAPGFAGKPSSQRDERGPGDRKKMRIGRRRRPLR